MIYRSIAAATALACVAATPAHAQQTGLRTEATLGLDVLSSDDGLEGAADTIDDGLSGTRAGIAIGYDVAVAPSIFVGVEAGVGTNLSGSIDGAFGGDTLRVTAARDIDVSVRAGLAVTPRTLVFAKIGYADSRLMVTLRERIGNTTEVTRTGDNDGALRLGAGIEHALASRLYVKAEYRRTRYGDDVAYQSTTTRHQLLAGLGLRF